MSFISCQELGERVEYVPHTPRALAYTILMCLLAKWLGQGAITPLAIDGKGGKAELLEKVARWVAARGRNVTQPVMIVSYETLRTLTTYLAGCKIGLLLCDEGHRLKNSESQTFQALNGLDVSRRVILTGTPIQVSIVLFSGLPALLSAFFP